MNPLLRALLLAVAATTLAACDTVEFESPPGELTECDEALVGDWRVEPLGKDADDDGRQYLRVTAACERWWTVSEERGSDGALEIEVDDIEEDLVLGFARTSTQAFIAARDRPKESEAPTQDKPNGYTLVAWKASGDDTLTLRQVDLREVAHLIVDERVPGWIEKRDRRPDGTRSTSSFWVFVFGSPDEVRTLLETYPVLDEPWLRLHPASADERAEIDGWLRDAGSDRDGFEARGMD